MLIPPCNMTKKRLKVMKPVRLNKGIRILQADRDNSTVVMDESKYKDKLITLLESRFMNPCLKDPVAKVEKEVQKLLSKSKLPFLLI
jgi:hypothetical protein